MSFSYLSRVGFPLQILSPTSEAPDDSFREITQRNYRGFHKKGERLGQFVFPQNAMIFSHSELYSRYDLYENRRGIWGMGQGFFPLCSEWISEQVYLLTTECPVFVGDFPILSPNNTILWALGKYYPQEEIWKIHVLWGTPPKNARAVPQNLWNQSLVDLVDELHDAVHDFVSQCSAADGKIIVDAAEAMFRVSVDKMKEKLREVQL